MVSRSLAGLKTVSDVTRMADPQRKNEIPAYNPRRLTFQALAWTEGEAAAVLPLGDLVAERAISLSYWWLIPLAKFPPVLKFTDSFLDGLRENVR